LKISRAVLALLIVVAIVTSSRQARGQDAADLLAQTPQRLQASNPVHNNQFIGFGAAVGIDGDVLLVGAPGEDSSTTMGVVDTGAVYVFERQGFDWVEVQKLRAPTELANEKFGAAVGVALGDAGVDALIVGAPGYSATSGRAYLYERTDGGSWEHEATLTQDVPNGGDLFGGSVGIDFFVPPNSLSGDPVFIAVASSPFDRDPLDAGNSQHGSIRVFQRTGDPPTWGPSHDFYGEPNERLGASVAIAGPDIVAGATGLDGPGTGDGGGRVFRQANELPVGFNYVESWELQTAAAVNNLGLGQTAALDDDTASFGTAVLGAPGYDQPVLNAGKIYVFDLTPGGMGTIRNEVAEIQPASLPAGAAFGTSIALSGPILAVGAPGLTGEGKIYLYERGATKAVWNPAGELTPPPLTPPFSCTVAAAVALQGLTAGIGCPTTTSRYQDEGVYLYFGSGIFVDDFEGGNTGRWTVSVP